MMRNVGNSVFYLLRVLLVKLIAMMLHSAARRHARRGAGIERILL